MCYVKKQKADYGAVSCNVVIFSAFNNLPILSTGGAELLTNLKSYFRRSQCKGKTWAIPCQCQKAASGKKWHGNFCHAMNTIVGFDDSDIMVFHDKEDAVQPCERLNKDNETFVDYGYLELTVTRIA